MERISAGETVRGGSPSTASSAGPTQVLLVEDNPADARLLCEYLEDVERPYVVHHVTRLREAVNLLGTVRPDVVILDLNLPDSTGISTIKGIRRKERKVPIVVLTGVEDEELEGRVLQNGAEIFVAKGRFSGELLAHAIKYAMAQHRVARMPTPLPTMTEMNLLGLVEAIPAGLLVLDADEHIRYANPAAARLLGEHPRALIGRKLEQVGASDRLASYEREVRSLRWDGREGQLLLLKAPVPQS